MMTSEVLPATDPAGRPSNRAASTDDSIESENDLARMIRLLTSNDRLLDEMRSLRCRTAEAEAYLSRPGSGFRLGAAYLDRLILRRSAVLARLRANRIEARELLHSLNH